MNYQQFVKEIFDYYNLNQLMLRSLRVELRPVNLQEKTTPVPLLELSPQNETLPISWPAALLSSLSFLV